MSGGGAVTSCFLEVLLAAILKSGAGGINMLDYFPGIKNSKHVFVFFQQTQKQNSLEHNFYIFDIFHLDGDGPAKLSTSQLQYGTSYYPDVDYEGGFKLWIVNHLINYRYIKNDYNSGTQLNDANFYSIYPIIYFDLRSAKESVSDSPKRFTLHYRLIEAAVLNKGEVVVRQIGSDLVVVGEKSM